MTISQIVDWIVSGKRLRDLPSEDYRTYVNWRRRIWVKTETGQLYRSSDRARYLRTDTCRSANSRSRLKEKLRVIAELGGKCACCGESRIEFLSVDHVNGGGAKHRREIRSQHRSIYRYLVFTKFLDRHLFQILCFNCNLAIGFHGYCPHQQAQK